MGRPEKAVAGTGPVAELALALRELRARAGGPSYKVLSGRASFSPAVLAAAAAGNRCPTLEVTEAFARACGARPESVRRLWEAADREERAARHAERLGNVSSMPYRRQAERRGAAPDPWKAVTTAGYIHLLGALRAWGGNPGPRAVDLAGRPPGGGRWLSSSSFYDALSERRRALPPLRFVEALAEACGGNVVQWSLAWRALSVAEFERAHPAPAGLAAEGADATVHVLRAGGGAG